MRIAGSSKPTKVKQYVKAPSLKPTNSSLQFRLRHVNCAAASSGEIVTDCAGTISWPLLDGPRSASLDSSMEALCGSTNVVVARIVTNEVGRARHRQKEGPRLCSTPPITVSEHLTVNAPVVATVLSVHTGSETLPELRTRWRIIEVNCCLGESLTGPRRQPPASTVLRQVLVGSFPWPPAMESIESQKIVKAKETPACAGAS
jgi:hypothetical protein